jgi:hypothetical protein
MSRFIFICCRLSLLSFSIISFNLMDRLIDKMGRLGSGPVHHDIYLLTAVALVPLLTVSATFAMLRLLDVRHRYRLILLSAFGVLSSFCVDVTTKDGLLLAFGLFLIPQLPTAFGKNMRPEGWPVPD